MSDIGDNSNQALKSLAERIVRRSIEKREAAEDINEMFKEAKSDGHNVKALRKYIRRVLQTPEQIKEEEETNAIADTYAIALGMIV